LGSGIWIGGRSQAFEVLYKYSPYQHVDKGANIRGAVVTGDSDTQCAAARAENGGADAGSTASERPILLRTTPKRALGGIAGEQAS